MVSEGAVTRALEEAGFEVQHVDGVVGVRAAGPELFARVELDWVGRPPDALVVARSVSVVRDSRLVWRGLVERTGLESLCTDVENGRVVLTAEGDWTDWLRRLQMEGPAECMSLANERGGRLLERTLRSRSYARQLVEHHGDAVARAASLSARPNDVFPLGDSEQREAMLLAATSGHGPMSNLAHLTARAFVGHFGLATVAHGTRDNAVEIERRIWAVRIAMDRIQTECTGPSSFSS